MEGFSVEGALREWDRRPWSDSLKAHEQWSPKWLVSRAQVGVLSWRRDRERKDGPRSGLGAAPGRRLWWPEPLSTETFRKIRLSGGSKGVGLEVGRPVGDQGGGPGRGAWVCCPVDTPGAVRRKYVWFPGAWSAAAKEKQTQDSATRSACVPELDGRPWLPSTATVRPLMPPHQVWASGRSVQGETVQQALTHRLPRESGPRPLRWRWGSRGGGPRAGFQQGALGLPGIPPSQAGTQEPRGTHTLFCSIASGL